MAQTMQKLDLNLCDRDDLLKIEGVDEKSADLVINYRRQHGDFIDVDELEDIPDLPRDVREKIMSHVQVTRASTTDEEDYG